MHRSELFFFKRSLNVRPIHRGEIYKFNHTVNDQNISCEAPSRGRWAKTSHLHHLRTNLSQRIMKFQIQTEHRQNF